MTALLAILQYTVAAAFLVLGLSATVEALQHRERVRTYLALSLVLVSLVPVIGRVEAAIGMPSVVLQYLAVLAFLGSGYGILLFRTCFVPLSRPRHLVAASAVVVAALVALAAGLPPHSRLPSSEQSLVADLVILTWIGLVGEPVIRFWRASYGRPRVQRVRLRGLSVAFAVLIAILLVATVAGNRVHSTGAQVATQIVALAMVPVLYGSLSRPGQLGHRWLALDNNELQDAIKDLLVFSPDRASAAQRAVGWTARLLGAEGAFVLDCTGEPLAEVGMSPALLSAVSVAWREQRSPDGISWDGLLRKPSIVLGLPMECGLGLLGAIPGPFTPVFGDPEVAQLHAYKSAVAASLDRVRTTERLAAMERAKSQFLNLASHELRGPVAIIRGYTAMLERGTFGQLNEAGVRAVGVMSSKVVQMDGLIEQMLDAARLEEGRLQLEIRPIEVGSVVERAVDVMRPLADATHALVLRQEGVPLVVPVDAERVQTIVTNLVDNAIKYSPAGGQVECRVTGTDQAVLVAVRDRGVGIAREDLPRLFSRFGRVSSEATKHIPGVGLGLYLARELARLHGGDISVESQPGVGSTFVLALPRHRPASMEAAAESSGGD